MKDPADRITAVCCGIFRRELEHLGPGVLAGARPKYLDSMMHMRPARLDAILARLTGTHPERRFLLLYGDCSPHMTEFSARPRVRRVHGVNCCEIMLGRDRYRELRREGAFLFLPEWTTRWEEVFKAQLGLADPALARSFMHDLHTRLLYLDTGLTEIPRQRLADIAAHFGMPVEVRAIGLEHLEAAVADGLRRLDRDG